MKKLTKLIAAAAVAVLGFATISAPAYAVNDICGQTGVPQAALDAAGCSNSGTETQFRNTITNILSAIIGVLGLVAVIVIIIGGVNYMTSTGDPSKTKRARETIIYGAVGLAIAALSFGIVNLAVNIINNGDNGTTNSSNSSNSSNNSSNSSNSSNNSSSNGSTATSTNANLQAFITDASNRFRNNTSSYIMHCWVPASSNYSNMSCATWSDDNIKNSYNNSNKLSISSITDCLTHSGGAVWFNGSNTCYSNAGYYHIYERYPS